MNTPSIWREARIPPGYIGVFQYDRPLVARYGQVEVASFNAQIVARAAEHLLLLRARLQHAQFPGLLAEQSYFLAPVVHCNHRVHTEQNADLVYGAIGSRGSDRSEEHTSELQS